MLTWRGARSQRGATGLNGSLLTTRQSQRYTPRSRWLLRNVRKQNRKNRLQRLTKIGPQSPSLCRNNHCYIGSEREVYTKTIGSVYTSIHFHIYHTIRPTPPHSSLVANSPSNESFPFLTIYCSRTRAWVGRHQYTRMARDFWSSVQREGRKEVG